MTQIRRKNALIGRSMKVVRSPREISRLRRKFS
jgi:hypothetical protein